ncbi:Gmad2 immunoglobulin-like domain-containing protein [Monashia sp. NPDC004114]
MNNEPTRPTPGRGDEEPVRIGAGLRPVEEHLRRSLASEAQRISPTERLAAILDDAHVAESSTTHRPHRWLVPAAAAAVALLVGGTVWAVNRPSGNHPSVAGSTVATSQQTSSVASSAPSSVPTSTATGPTTSSTTPEVPPATATVSLPVYYVGPVAPGSDQRRLFREFVPVEMPKSATPEDKALAALRHAFGPPNLLPSSPPYDSPWAASVPLAVSVADGQITVKLSTGLGQTPTGGGALAVQQIVWTVQAALAQGALPVRITVPHDADLAPGLPSTAVYNRPTDQIEVLTVVAPVWIDQPYRGQVLKAGRPLDVSGLASTFEANVQWQLLKSGTEVESGFTTADAGAPARGKYSFSTNTALDPGSYVIRVYESSAKDGSVTAEQRIPFTVR